VKCVRPKCTRTANRQGLCHSHYRYAPSRGYVDGEPTRERIRLLLARGVGWRGIYEQTGLTVSWLLKSTSRVQARTQEKIFSIPVPPLVVPGGYVAAVGTVRRIQALAALGWPQSTVSVRMGHNPHYANQLLRRDIVLSATAEKVERVYRELNMIPGPSENAARVARKHSWPPPLAWDNIDDPDETPNVGEHVHVSAWDRVEELHELGVFNVNDIAERLGVKADSVERLMFRQREKEDAA